MDVETCAMLEAGAMSIRRTNKPFKDACGFEFRTDNVNADVPSRLEGVASFSKSASAKRKWK